MVPIQEELLCPKLYPHFVLGIECKLIQSCDVQPECVGPSEFSETGPQWHQLVTGDVGGQRQDLFTHVGHPVAVQLKQLGAVRPVNQQLKILPEVFCYLFKHDMGLLFSQRLHFLLLKHPRVEFLIVLSVLGPLRWSLPISSLFEEKQPLTCFGQCLEAPPSEVQ